MILGKPLKPKAPPKKYVPKRTVCDECGSSVTNLKEHIKNVHEEHEVPCPHCDAVLKGKAHLQGHIKYYHDFEPCVQCGEMISKKKMARHISAKHMSIYDRKHKCDVCGKGFFEASKLAEHHNVHTGAKPFKCKFCSASFASNGTMRAHQRSHLGIKRASK